MTVTYKLTQMQTHKHKYKHIHTSFCRVLLIVVYGFLVILLFIPFPLLDRMV